ALVRVAAALAVYRTLAPKHRAPAGPAATRQPVLIVLPQQFCAADYRPMREILEKEGGYEVRVASSSRNPCVPLPGSGGGEPVTPDLALGDSVRADDYAAVIFPGGFIH